MAKFMTFAAAYVLLERDGKVYLMRRANAPYRNGYFGLPSGHIEEGETPVEAAVRELAEEAGVVAKAEDMEFIHVVYRRSVSGEPARTYNDYFFVCRRWEGEPRIMESDKCDAAEWVSPDALPEKMVDEVAAVLKVWGSGQRFTMLEV